MGEGLEPSAELRLRTADTLADGTHPTVVASQQSDDAVSLAQLLGAQNHTLVTVERHRSIVALRGRLLRRTGTRRAPQICRTRGPTRLRLVAQPVSDWSLSPSPRVRALGGPAVALEHADPPKASDEARVRHPSEDRRIAAHCSCCEPLARLTADTTAFNDAVTMFASTPTPQRMRSPIAHSTYAAARASPPELIACSA